MTSLGGPWELVWNSWNNEGEIPLAKTKEQRIAPLLLALYPPPGTSLEFAKSLTASPEVLCMQRWKGPEGPRRGWRYRSGARRPQRSIIDERLSGSRSPDRTTSRNLC